VRRVPRLRQAERGWALRYSVAQLVASSSLLRPAPSVPEHVASGRLM